MEMLVQMWLETPRLDYYGCLDNDGDGYSYLTDSFQSPIQRSGTTLTVMDLVTD